VLKIENRQAFENLPRILLTSLRSPPVGVMVARGDLAVEVGFERLSEVQEEILWLCEAAHVPVVWATQILEGMAKKGAPSRAEISDAVMSSRAECAMLNKAPTSSRPCGSERHPLAHGPASGQAHGDAAAAVGVRAALTCAAADAASLGFVMARRRVPLVSGGLADASSRRCDDRGTPA